ncbi:hypothetical protein INT43_005806 [Umbelopsis isabellina]|uniref:Uncharacterized protein n=1 Tax=Mortierella isabellina TaxID=91625 RepID=A0A8H7PJ04_MORIS|nr:hypothetical protein INT43_005806 [Umbelopsis isabellina]
MTRLTLLFAVTFAYLAVATKAAATEEFGICSCFTPKYDASCCLKVKGTQFQNVCDTPDFKGTVSTYESCCTGSGGKYKCKIGYREVGHYPDEPTQYNCTTRN